ncbi:hypothetical protein Taro_018784 [Colocasia esculenta]|uniref:ABCA1-4-like C-terminal R2 regulatory domain-containing protein n=1 Tax=Colocasia esculenta TaxID=4460 RepID=A0A843UXA5_COLES|nr:hypothetical protein [Colocasia esculenta]
MSRPSDMLFLLPPDMGVANWVVKVLILYLCQLPYGPDSSLADIFGHIEHHRRELGIQEYSVSQSTLETIFNHFAASQ